MINPGGIPRIPGDMEVLARHAEELKRVGPAFSATGEQVNSTWQQLAPVYDAPEVGQLLAATGPVQTTSASVGADIATVGGALSTYATAVKQIQNQLDALRAQAQELVAEAEADKANEGGLEQVGEFVGIGGDDDEYAERSNELTGQVNAQVAAFYEAQRVCANTVNALYGGTQYRAGDGDAQQEPGEYGYTAEQLDAAFEQGQELPWGSYAETDTGIVGGVWDGMKTLAGDLGALIGRDPVTGDWSWGTAGTAWKGLGTFALAIGTYAMPGGAALDQTLNDGKLGNTLVAAGKGIIAYDEWGKGDNARAGGMAGFNILSSIVGTKGAGSALRGVGAGAKTSRIGAVSRAGGAMVRGGEFLGRLPTTESLIGKVSQHLPGMRLPGGIPDVNVPHHADTPSVDTPRVDTPRVDTPNPGSVGDNLADTGRTPDGDTPSVPNAPSAPDVPGSRGGDAPPPGAAVPDAPSAPDAPTIPDAPRTPDTPSGPDGSAPDTPGDRTPDTGMPGDRAPGDTTPGDTTPTNSADTGDRSDYDRAPDFRATDADRQAFREAYSEYAEDARFIEDIKARDPAYQGIPTEDLAAIRGYTGDEFYRQMNQGMREGDSALLERYDPHIRTITSGLDQLPAYEGVVGRGITINDPAVLQNLVNRYEPGQIVREPSFVSTDTRASLPRKRTVRDRFPCRTRRQRSFPLRQYRDGGPHSPLGRRSRCSNGRSTARPRPGIFVWYRAEEAGMSEPTKDELLDKIRRWSEEKRSTPDSERRWVTRPEKYDYPIGIDPEGRPYPVPPPREEE